jgi:GDP-mannose 6-dehydrogenase
LKETIVRIQQKQNVIVMGLGYVGCVTAAGFAELGHDVLGVDRDMKKVDAVARGRSPFFEPGLDELIEKNVLQDRLRAGSLDQKELDWADVIMLCVGTPSQANGNIDLSHLRRVCSEIAELLQARSKPLIIVVRSTVFPGTGESLLEEIFRCKENIHLVSNPEFLREGNALKDFMEPSILVVGGSSDMAAGRIADLYDGLGVRATIVQLRTAELIKYACNAFHAVKVGFANEIGSLAANVGVNPEEVMSTLCADHRLNTSSAYLTPGFAFGGSCLPKDLRALTYRASRLDLNLPLLGAVLASNDEHLRRRISLVTKLSGRRIGIFGLAFKEGTDDLRESPAITMIEYLIGKGRDLRIFDPHIQLEEIYGSNLNFVVSALPHISKLLVKTIDQLLISSDVVVFAQKPDAASLAQLRRSGLPILDLTQVTTEINERASDESAYETAVAV